VELIAVPRLENILKEALEKEAIPVMATASLLSFRFVCPGHVFAVNGKQHKGEME
jgi:hypothetical protein